MKRGTKLIAMLSVMVLIVAAFVLVTLLSPKEDASGNGSTYEVILKLDKDKITNIGWEFSTAASFTKTENGWVNDADSLFPTDEDCIDKMLEAVYVISATKTIESPEDLDQYGLKNPFCTVKFTADGKTYNLTIGDQNSFTGGRYIALDDGKVYMVDNEIAACFNFGPEGALKEEEIPELESLSNLHVQTQDRSYEITWLTETDKTYSSHYKWFMGDKVLDTELTDELMDTFYSLEWKECVDYNATDLAKYGLDKPSAVATVTYLKDKTFVLEVGNETDKGAYARIAGSNMVYYVRNAVRNVLCNTVYNELMPDEVLAMKWDTVTGMDIVIGDKTYTLNHDEVPDVNGCATGEFAWKYNGEEVKASTITNKLDNMSSSGYATGLSTDLKEELRFLIRRSAGHHTQVELVFYTYNSTTCLVTLDGEPTVLTDRVNVTSLITTINNLLAAK